MADWPTDKELEEIYRKGSELHDFSYDPKSWAEMETLLDKEKRRRFFILMLAGLLIISVSIFSFFQINSKKELTSQDEPTALSTEQTDNPTQFDTKISAEIALEKNLPSAKIEDGENAAAISKQLQTNDLPISDKLSTNKVDQKQDIYSHHNTSQKRNSTPNQIQNEDTNTENKIVEVISTENHSVVESQISIAAGTVEIPRFEKFAFLQIERPAPSLLPTTFSPLDLDEFKIIPVENDYQHRPNFSLWIAGGIESSWTPNGEYSNLDLSIGLGLRLHLSRRFSLIARGMYVNDIYTAHQGDYLPSEDFWPRGEEPIYTAADCKMIQLSTGIRYHFSSYNEPGFSIGVEALSNFMLNEKYYYHYNEVNNNFMSEWSGSDNTWFNALGLNPSYQFKYSKRGLIEIGPYFKLPIRGIGHGDVMLSAFGLRASVSIAK